MVWTASVAEPGIVNEAAIAINKRAVQQLIAQDLSLRPVINLRFGHPDAVSPESTRGNLFAKPHQTFASRGILRESARCRESRGIHADQMKRHQSTGRLTRNDCGENTISLHRI